MPAWLPGSCNSAGRVGQQVLGGGRQPVPLPCPLLPLVGGDSSPAWWHLAAPNPRCVCGWNILLLAAPARCPAGLVGSRDATRMGGCQDPARTSAGRGSPAAWAEQSAPDSRALPAATCVPVTGTPPGAGPYRTSHLAPSLPCPGPLPGSTAWCQASLPGGLS